MTWDMGGPDNQVFVDGVMMTLAQFPNTGAEVSHPAWGSADDGSPHEFSGETTWMIQDSALNQPNGFWVGAEVTHMGTIDIYAQSGIVTGSSPGQVSFTTWHDLSSRQGIQSGTHYYLSNVLGALDTAREWFYGGGTLYLWTPAGDNPTSHTVEAKRRAFAFDLKGRSYITVHGLNLFAASIDMDNSSSHNMIDGIRAKYVWHEMRIGVQGSYTQGDPKWGAWNTGIRLAGSDNTLQNCEIQYSSGNGVYLLGTHQKVTNCLIHDVAYRPAEAGGVSTMGEYYSGANTSDHEVSWNTIYNSGRYGVNHYYAMNMKILHNHIHDILLQTTDGGGTYTVKGRSSGEIAYNIIHDNRAAKYGVGIYMDNTSSDWLVHHNVVYRTPSEGALHNSYE